MRFRGIVLDVDGTLVDSNDAHAWSWVETLARSGRRVTYSEVRRLIGKGGDKLLAETVGLDRHSPEGERVAAQRREAFLSRYLPQVRAFPGARALVERLRGLGLRIAVASSAEADELAGLLRLARVDDLVEETTSSSDAERSKPDPDIVEAALERLGLPADEVVMLGDTPYDVEAAGRAGVACVALRCGGWDDADLEGALAVYDDPADLHAHLDESPILAEPGAREPAGAASQPGAPA